MTRRQLVTWSASVTLSALAGHIWAAPQDITNDPKANYSAVRQQQGRVKLDADWNESVARRAAQEPELTRLRAYLLARLEAADDGTEAALALLELFSAVGDTLAAYQDRAANEVELNTARQRRLAAISGERLRALEAEIVRIAGDEGRQFAVRTEEGGTQVRFGDGESGRRLPSGMRDIIATYRGGGGAAVKLGDVGTGKMSLPGGAAAAWTKGSLGRKAAGSICQQFAERTYRICTIRDRASRSPTLSVYTVPGEQLHAWLYETEGFPGEGEVVVSVEALTADTGR
jgi:hypothetical protein